MPDKASEEAILTFVMETRDGKYMEIPPYLLEYLRISEEAEFIDDEANCIITYYC